MSAKDMLPAGAIDSTGGARRSDQVDAFESNADRRDGTAASTSVTSGAGRPVSRMLDHARASLGPAIVQRKVQRRAEASAGGASGEATTSRPTLRVGSSGPDVVALQEGLIRHGAQIKADGGFGPKTLAEVKAFQSGHGLTADGVVGAKTWQALDEAPGSGQTGQGGQTGQTGQTGETGQGGQTGQTGQGGQTGQTGQTGQGEQAEKTPGDGGGASAGRRTLRKGMIGDDVRTMQEQLAATGLSVWPDGNFGKGTEKSVIAFQSKSGLDPSGAVGPETWAALDKVAPMVSGPATRQPRDPALQTLIDGGFADKGQYKSSNDGFADAQLDGVLKEYGKYWLVDTTQAPGADGGGKDNAVAGGHSAGKSIAEQPPWVGVIQQKLIAKSKWTDDEKASNKLIEAFMVAWNKSKPGGMASNVEEFYRHLGKSETNNQAGVLGGAKGNDNWCAAASSSATVLGLLRKGVRFSTGGPPAKQLPWELQKQTGALVNWETKRSGNTIGGKQAWTEPLAAGDIISIVGGGPLSGHVATVIEESGGTIKYVSGNAGGATGSEGAIRAEEVQREVPPDGYNYLAIAMNSNASAAAESTIRKLGAKDPSELTDEERQKLDAAKSKKDELAGSDLPTSRQDPRFRPGKHAPAKAGVVWVVSLYKTSKLNANVLTQDASGAALAKEGLERCEPLESLYPDHAKYGI